MSDRVQIVEQTLYLFVILDEYQAVWAKKTDKRPLVASVPISIQA